MGRYEIMWTLSFDGNGLAQSAAVSSGLVLFLFTAAQFTWMILHKHQCRELFSCSRWFWIHFGVINGHNISSMRHVLFRQLLDVETDIISTVRNLYIFVVHLNAENVSSTSRGVKLDINSRGNLSLFHSASHHITDSLDFVHSGYRHSERLLIVTLWWFHHFLQRVDQGMSLHLLFLDLHLEAFVPRHVRRGLVQVVTVESTHWDKW